MSELEIVEIDLPKPTANHEEFQDLDAVVDVDVVIQEHRAHDIHALDIADLRVDLGVGHQRLVQRILILLRLE